MFVASPADPFPKLDFGPLINSKKVEELRAFKVGINSVRSRGDREEVFGGIGHSWKGCLSVDAILSSLSPQAPPVKNSSAIPEEASPKAFATVG